MDPTQVDPHTLARQLRKPEGAMGEEVGKVLAVKHTAQIAFVFEFLHVQPADHVLEIGFGPGEGIAEAARRTPNGFVAGIDFSPTMVAMAEQRNHRAIMQEQVELTLGDAKELPYEDESFHKIFALNVFHFWPDPARELAECLRVLKPDGRIVFYLGHPSSWMPGFHETGIFIAREAQDIKAILSAAGFTNVSSRDFTFPEGKGFAVMGTK